MTKWFFYDKIEKILHKGVGMNSEKTNFVAFFDTETAEVYGQTPFFYFRISANPEKSYYYKAYQNDDAKKEHMTNDEIAYVFKLLKNYADKGVFQTIVCAMEDRYLRESMQKNAQPLKKAVIEPLQSNKVVVTRHNHQAQDQRKAKQRDKQLAKFASIAPVVITDVEGKETALCVKKDDAYYYVSLDEKKPAFWMVGLTKGEVVDVYRVGELIEYIADNQKTEQIACRLPVIYKAFKEAGYPAPTKTANEVYYSTVRIALAKGLQRFSPVERKMCVETKKRQR